MLASWRPVRSGFRRSGRHYRRPARSRGPCPAGGRPGEVSTHGDSLLSPGALEAIRERLHRWPTGSPNLGEATLPPGCRGCMRRKGIDQGGRDAAIARPRGSGEGGQLARAAGGCAHFDGEHMYRFTAAGPDQHNHGTGAPWRRPSLLISPSAETFQGPWSKRKQYVPGPSVRHSRGRGGTGPVEHGWRMRPHLRRGQRGHGSHRHGKSPARKSPDGSHRPESTARKSPAKEVTGRKSRHGSHRHGSHRHGKSPGATDVSGLTLHHWMQEVHTRRALGAAPWPARLDVGFQRRGVRGVSGDLLPKPGPLRRRRRPKHGDRSIVIEDDDKERTQQYRLSQAVVEG